MVSRSCITDLSGVLSRRRRNTEGEEVRVAGRGGGGRGGGGPGSNYYDPPTRVDPVVLRSYLEVSRGPHALSTVTGEA